MLGEIIPKLPKVKVDSIIMSGNVLAWTKRIEVQRAQSTVLSSITEAKELDKIKISKNACKDSPRRTTQIRVLTKQTCRYCRSSHPPRQCLLHGKVCMECKKIGHFRVVCRSRRTRAVNEVEQETVQNDARENIELVSINSFQFNKNHSILTINLKTSADQSNIMVPYKIDSGSNGNIMALHMYRKLFPNITNEKLSATKNKNVILKMYNKTTITQLGTYKQ